MPLFYQHNINDDTRLGVWKIAETEDFFLNRVPLQRNISHPHKRLQHLAGRYLLQYLFPGFPYDLIAIADTRKPFLTNEAYHFSISHCGDYAAVVVSRSCRVGLDIELVKPAIEKIKQKFLSGEEMQMLQISNARLPLPSSRLLTLAWSAKEAMFKWFGEGGVDFRQHMKLIVIHGNETEGTMDCSFSRKTLTSLFVSFRVFDDLVLAWVVTGS